jgi:hypothetical protein
VLTQVGLDAFPADGAPATERVRQGMLLHACSQTDGDKIITHGSWSKVLDYSLDTRRSFDFGPGFYLADDEFFLEPSSLSSSYWARDKGSNYSARDKGPFGTILLYSPNVWFTLETKNATKFTAQSSFYDMSIAYGRRRGVEPWADGDCDAVSGLYARKYHNRVADVASASSAIGRGITTHPAMQYVATSRVACTIVDFGLLARIDVEFIPFHV